MPLSRRRRRRERCAALVVRGNSRANGPGKERCAGLVVRGNSRANAAKSMWREHGLAVAVYHSHLTFEANSILHTGDRTEPEAAAGEKVFKLGYEYVLPASDPLTGEKQVLELQNGAIIQVRPSTTSIERNLMRLFL